jgi:hypothetical protein
MVAFQADLAGGTRSASISHLVLAVLEKPKRLGYIRVCPQFIETKVSRCGSTPPITSHPTSM